MRVVVATSDIRPTGEEPFVLDLGFVDTLPLGLELIPSPFETEQERIRPY